MDSIIHLTVLDEERKQVFVAEMTRFFYHNFIKAMPAVIIPVRPRYLSLMAGRVRLQALSEASNGTGIISHEDIIPIYDYLVYAGQSLFRHDPLFAKTFLLMLDVFRQARNNDNYTVKFDTIKRESLPMPAVIPCT
jgi:hypothetical protein